VRRPDIVISELIEEFLKAGSYLRNWSPQTSLTYKKGLDSFSRSHSTLSKTELEKWVVGMRSRGLSPGGVNVHIRSMNSFLPGSVGLPNRHLRSRGHRQEFLLLVCGRSTHLA
jgi:hypothetical protein